MGSNRSNFSSQNDQVDVWSLQSPIDCKILKGISVYCILLFISSIFFNTSLLMVFFKHKTLRSPLNIFIIALTAYNLIASIIELPLVIISNYLCRWPFGKIGCHFSGVVMYIVGTFQMYLMAAISMERFLVVYKPLLIKKMNKHVILSVIGICTLMGILWALFPYLGWSYYSLEGALTSCSVEWSERSINVMSYNTCMFIFVFLLPFIIILIANFKLIIIIKSLPNLIRYYSGNRKMRKKLKLQKKLSYNVIILVFGYLLSWTPYGIVSLYRSFIGHDLPPLAGTLPAMFAKSTLVWSSIFISYSNQNIRIKLFWFKNS